MTDPALIRKLLHSLGRLTQSELDSGLAAVGRMEHVLKVLRAIEWVGREEHDFCPACDAPEHRGHRPGCQLVIALGEQRGR